MTLKFLPLASVEAASILKPYLQLSYSSHVMYALVYFGLKIRAFYIGIYKESLDTMTVMPYVKNQIFNSRSLSCEKNISTQSACAQAPSWFPGTYANSGGS